MHRLLGTVLPVRRPPSVIALALLTALIGLSGLVATASPARAAAPANDNRADATTWNYDTSNVFGNDNTEATNEPGETGAMTGCTGPASSVPSSGHSVWYRFVPPASTTYVFDVGYSTFDTVLSLETQSGTGLACNDDKASGDNKSRLEVALIAGNVYYLRLAGWSSTQYGGYTVYLQALAPANNDRADATTLSTALDHASVALLAADTEPGELDPPDCEYGMQQTVWFRYHATSTGRLAITNHRVRHTRMRLFDATSDSPQVMVCDSYHEGLSGDDGIINQYVTAGRDYLLQIGRPSDSSPQSTSTISTSFVASARPANDSFATPATLTGGTGSFDVEAAQMTTEPFEYPLYGSEIGRHSAWYRWTAPASGTLRLSYVNQSVLVWADVAFPDLLDKDGLGTIAYTPAGEERSVTVTKGTTYRVLADWRSPAAFTVTYALTPDGTGDVPATPPAGGACTAATTAADKAAAKVAKAKTKLRKAKRTGPPAKVRKAKARLKKARAAARTAAADKAAACR